MSGESQSDTVDDLRIPGAAPAAVPGVAATPPDIGFDVELAGLTHTGKVRAANEDNFHVVRFGRYMRMLATSLPPDHLRDEFDQPGYGIAVADGVGGHVGGEVASRLAITVLLDMVLHTPDWILGHEEFHLETVMARSSRRFRGINEAVLAEARDHPALRGMGTTLSLAVTLGTDLIVAHVGDSPVFLYREGRLERLTRDHVAKQLWPGNDPSAVARVRLVLTRAIGISETGGEPDVGRYKLADGDRLLLCTDGLTDMVRDDAIAAELARGAPAEETCRALVALALDGGGRDNITVVVAAYRTPEANAAGE